MNCGEFEQAWQDRLDQPDGEPGEDLARHAVGCPACARKHAGYVALIAALADRPPALGTVVPAGFADRILAASVGSPTIGPIRRGLASLAMAAGVLLAIGLGWNGWKRPGPDSPPISQADLPQPLSEAVDTFTSASLALARETSAPAARLGWEALSRSSAEAPAEGDGPLEDLSARLDEELAPLRGSTRRAFSFLLGPEPARIDAG